MTIECGKEKKYKCGLCYNAYYYKSDWKKHKLKVHNIY